MELPLNRVCFSCKIEKPIIDFYKSNTRYYQRECKVCNKERKEAWHKTESGKQSSRNTKLKARFGITLEEYNKMLSNQKGKCMICSSEVSYMNHNLAVDHDHITGKVRSLLCKACNLGIGNFKENVTFLSNAILYLKAHNQT